MNSQGKMMGTVWTPRKDQTHMLSKQNAQTHRTVKNESLIPNFSLFWYTDMQIHHI